VHAPSCTRSLLSRGFVYDGGDKFGGSPNGGDAGDGENEERDGRRTCTISRKRSKKRREREGEKKDADSDGNCIVVS